MNNSQIENVKINESEIKIIEKYISHGGIVFDVGTQTGAWTLEVINRCKTVQVHLFESWYKTYQKLLQNLANYIPTGRILFNQYHLSKIPLNNLFDSSFPNEKLAFMTGIDDYCNGQKIRRIDFLRIGLGVESLDLLQSGREFLRKGSIDYIQFYGNNIKQEVFQYLQNLNYEIFKVQPNNLEHIKDFLTIEETSQNLDVFLAINERFRTFLIGKVEAPDLQKICQQYSIKPSGVIHIGAHEGQEITVYNGMGLPKILFVEANPNVFERLNNKLSGAKNVQTVNCAISNQDDQEVVLHITSNNELSSSIFPLKEHLRIHPSVKEINQIKLKSKTIDTLIKELELNPAEFNILNIDIQGAELLALQGATNWLKYVEVVYTEVNYEELYEGTVLIDELDDFLELYGFERIVTNVLYHPSWGDAIYVKKPVITMSKLGYRVGLANQLFQYAFLNICAKENNCRIETPTWIGQYIFGHQDLPIIKALPPINENQIINSQVPIKNRDLVGFFLGNTNKYYSKHKDYLRNLFTPIAEIESQMAKGINFLRQQGKTIVGIHLRRGDFQYSQGIYRGHHWIAPSLWYKEWLNGFWETLDNPVLFIASDEIDKVKDDFTEYNPLTVKDLDIELPKANFYPDFYILTKSDVLGISNSTFSFMASMLNETAKFFFRPHLTQAKLIPFDPWNSDPSLFFQPKAVDDMEANQKSPKLTLKEEQQKLKEKLNKSKEKLEKLRIKKTELKR